ncbi:hypothetical protein [Flavimaricola marinus]|uniref:Uncharacterized protein n=1 Tax=Flavimaricola marinus TaxID=1819565 RepID=A0A238LBF2_9RHOB|nr:hypothetical protein [Flavimaricola marinus]SMY07009.1 hypothetical protein LOM8899_01140 [Flavimaricola marinus]
MWVFMIAQGVLFLAWSVEAFRILFQLAARGRARSGQLYPGPLTFVGAVREWIADPSRRLQKWRFVVLTLALLGMTACLAIWEPITGR